MHSKNFLTTWAFAAAAFAPSPVVASTPHSVDASREEVSFPSRDGFELEGTLRLPASLGATLSAMPVPGVVLVHGSGDANNRDERAPAFGFSIPVFAEIGDALQKRGIAVLTYDKRTCSSFNGCHNNSYPLLSGWNMSVDVFIEDALAAVNFLRTRSEVQPDAVAVVGHSQAGTYVPIMLESEPEAIQKGVMMAGTFQPFDQLGAWKLNLTSFVISALAGIDAWTFLRPEYAQRIQFELEFVQALRNGSSSKTEYPEYGLSATFWKSLFDIHDRALAAVANIGQPLLVLHGDMDWSVPPSDAEAWSDYLEGAGANYQTEILPCVTHYLNCIKRFPYDIGREVDPRVTDVLANFILGSSSTSQPAGDTSYSGVTRTDWLPVFQILLAIANLVGFF